MQYNDGGWDGQMYYYAASDLLDRHHTDKAMDVPAYRYQRIGLPLAAAAASIVFTGSHFVSGEVYFYTNFTIILIAVFAFATFLFRQGASPYLALYWGAFVSTVLCLLNGMPDVTADACFIIALVAYFSKRSVIYGVAMAMACLSREAFVLPAGILFGLECVGLILDHLPLSRFFDCFRRYSSWRGMTSVLSGLVPVLVFVGWQLYLKIHFGIFPSQQAGAVIEAVPFHALFVNFMGAIQHHHRVMSAERSMSEAWMLIIFVVLFLMAGLSIGRMALAPAILYRRQENITVTRSVAVSLGLLIILYAFFGNTVMEHYTGYLKASGIFPITVILDFALLKSTRRSFYIKLMVLLICVCASDGYLYYDRLKEVFPHHYKAILNYDDPDAIAANKMACLRAFPAQLRLVKVESVDKHEWLRRLYHRPIYSIFTLSVTNNGNKDILPVLKSVDHPLYLSYQWIDNKTGDITEDGAKALFQSPLQVGQSRDIDTLVRIKREPQGLSLRFSLYQEGCGWFYQKADGDSLMLNIDGMAK